LVDFDEKEWFCGRDVCLILGFSKINGTPFTKVKQAYKVPLSRVAKVNPNQTKNYHESKAVYP